MAYCPNCADEIAPDAPECPTCGALFGASSSWRPLSEAPADRDPKRIAELRAISERDRSKRARAASAGENRLAASEWRRSRIGRIGGFVASILIVAGIAIQLAVLDGLLREHFWPSHAAGGWLADVFALLLGFVAAALTLMLSVAMLSASRKRLRRESKGRIAVSLYWVACLVSALHVPAAFYVLGMPDPSLSRGPLSLIEYIYLRR